MATVNFDKIKAAYKAGLPIREQITNYSPMDMKNAIGNIVNFARLTCSSKMKDCENMTEKGVLDLKYGNEKNQEPDLTSFDFILKEATLSYGYYDIYKVRIDCLGIFVKYKEEHRQDEEILSLYWDDYEKLKEQHLEIFT
jgi:hypothetical protein